MLDFMCYLISPFFFFFFFKQKTAYEMLRSLVGSEMCIRDRYQRRVRGYWGATLMPRAAEALRAQGEALIEDVADLVQNVVRESNHQVVTQAQNTMLLHGPTISSTEQCLGQLEELLQIDPRYQRLTESSTAQPQQHHTLTLTLKLSNPRRAIRPPSAVPEHESQEQRST
eukprot:TRINITY_DN9357_c0_g2_i2.p1 TRINITY_DN9357_c0_g2~~TRINITY_DN9357_c0_g2_i2.p1  ORF type:complete len:170 (+),score=57.78 TRINITY_DN9357_c0_g2_i2:93-602(+)